MWARGTAKDQIQKTSERIGFFQAGDYEKQDAMAGKGSQPG